MRIAVITDTVLKEELLAQGLQEGIQVNWLEKPDPGMEADACIDLLFDHDPERIEALAKMPVALVMINDVCFKNPSLPAHFVRFNGWKSFLRRPLVELTTADSSNREKAEWVFGSFQKKAAWTDGQPGYMSARVVSMIINEAYLGLEEGLTSRGEIDTAMKLGTGYPYGPFEWAAIIGIREVAALLQQLSTIHSKYQPSALLLQEAGQS